MRSVLLKTVACAVFLGAEMSPATAADDYELSVDVLGEDGGVASHQQLKCRTYRPCLAEFPATVQGKPLTLHMKTQVHEDHQIGVMIFPPASPTAAAAPPFDMLSTFEAFEPGNEWTLDLKRDVVVPIDPSERKFKWITTQLEVRTVLTVRMKLGR